MSKDRRLLQDELFVITGANRGIGWETAKKLAEEGASLILGSREITTDFLSRCALLSDKEGVPIQAYALDLNSRESIESFSKFVRGVGPITGFVNNAGVTHNSLFQMSQIEDMRDVFETNFFGLASLSQSLIRHLIKGRRGSIVNIASSAATEANVGKSIYGASKAAVVTFTRALARELGAYGIRVNSVAPGITQTDMVASSMSTEKVEEVVAHTALHRAASPAEIAECVAFLLSNEASYVSGITLKVDGGLISS